MYVIGVIIPFTDCFLFTFVKNKIQIDVYNCKKYIVYICNLINQTC